MYYKIALTTKLQKLLFVLLFVFVAQGCKNTSSDSSATTYTSKQTKADKKKYYDSNENVVYEVKYKADAIKLRTASSALLWKIKLYDEKVKISDNEENENGYQIKIKGTADAKLERNDVNLARIVFDDSKNSIIITTNSGNKIIKEVSYSPAWLVLSIDEIPKDQQEIIIQELLEKGF